MESKPGPRLALLAGTRTLTDRPAGTRLTRSALETEGMGRRERVDRDAGRHDLAPVGGPQGPLGVLEPVTGHGAHDACAGGHEPCGVARQQARDRRGRAGLDEDALLRREVAVGVEDLLVGDGLDAATGLVAGGDGLLPRRRVADADRGRDGLGVVDRVAEDDRRGTGSLEAPHPGQVGRRSRGRVGDGLGEVLAVATPVRRDVAGVADREAVDVGGVAERVDDLEARGLLALDACRVDRVDELDGVGLGELACEGQAVVEVAVDLQQRGPVGDRLAQLAHRDLAVGHEDAARHAGLRRVGGGRRARVARARADDGLGPLAGGDADRRRHAAVLERAGGVEAFVLEVDLGADALGELLGVDERGAALVERDDGGALEHGKAVGVLADHSAPLVGHHEPSTRMTELTPRTTSSVRRRSTVDESAASLAVCVTMMRLALAASPSPAGTSCWRTVSIDTSWSAKAAATWARTPDRSSTSRLMWYLVWASPIARTGRSA